MLVVAKLLLRRRQLLMSRRGRTGWSMRLHSGHSVACVSVQSRRGVGMGMEAKCHVGHAVGDLREHGHGRRVGSGRCHCRHAHRRRVQRRGVWCRCELSWLRPLRRREHLMRRRRSFVANGR